jgi:UDP-3-O-[3-hydroxymyristoyl] N-acetylglucosamine deacetylase
VGASGPKVTEIVLEGFGLHSGSAVRVALRRTQGPVTLRVGEHRAPVAELIVAGTARSTTIEAPGTPIRIGMVEHLFAALGGLGVAAGLEIAVDGGEMPLLDGAARAWCDAIAALGPPRGQPRLRVVRPAILDVEASRYELTPGEGVAVSAHLELPDRGIVPDARWDGDAEDFHRRVASARTFCSVGDFDELGRLGLARHVDPEAVVVLAPDRVYCRGAFEADEPARHKLLDLVGDLYLHGGPARGRMHVRRPGHRANAAAIARALEEGILVRE